jgi:hypothetical protein
MSAPFVFSWAIFSSTPHTFSPNGMHRFPHPQERRNALGCSLSCGHFRIGLLLRCKG